MDAARHHETADRFADRAAIALNLAMATRRPWRRSGLMREARQLHLLAVFHANQSGAERLIADVKQPAEDVTFDGPATPTT